MSNVLDVFVNVLLLPSVFSQAIPPQQMSVELLNNITLATMLCSHLGTLICVSD